ncbi:MEDS domain-containing protein [Candidatus Manganitrophus noduliformans]|uniref:histidine kinase n=1 Tax=Candidatus Manganitrophus noduliformans TaxID=2606439 RepID=A0A7X6DLM7_9BACT|nr:MEDS domain-containing protein [Candidatus Manganitrophus noduliformans]NKE69465.1 PAS domain-containing protein [Candidatus Manganitrophus noduliformans]
MNELTEQILGLEPGDHLCLIYDQDPAEQMPALVPFIKQGLAGGEQCIYIADDQTTDEVARALEGSGIDVRDELKRGALLLWTREEWRQPGEFDSDKKAAQVRQFIDAAFAAGFTGIRFAVEMTWTLGPAISAERLKHWEATINKIFIPGFPGRIVCQYSRHRLAPAVVETSLNTHPLAIIGQTVYPNLFYEAPLILDGRSEADKLDWMISQLKNARLEEKKRAGHQEREQNKRLRQIYQLNDQVNRAEALEEIYKASLDMILQSVKADRAAILLMDDDQVMRFKAWRGLSEEYREAVQGHSPWQPGAPDPQPVCIPDIDHAPLDAPLREVVRREGIQALGFFPLVYQKRLLGKFMVYYNTAHPFLEEEVQLAQTIAGHVAFSIQSKRREEALRQSQERLNVALSAGRMGAWEWDLRTGKIAWNSTLEAIHGIPPGTFGGCFEDFKRDIHPEDLERVLAAINRTLRDGSEYQIEYRILSPDQRLLWLEARGQLFLDANGRPERMVGVCMDITERKRMEEALTQRTSEAQEASRVKSEFVSNVSHELRTPLNAIIGFSHLVLGHIYGSINEEQRSALEGVIRNADDLRKLIDNLLDLSKIESGKTPLKIAPVEIPALIEDVSAGLQSLLEKKRLSLHCEKRTLPLIQSDADKIKQILVNLLSNAIKFTPEGGVTVEMEDRPEREGIEIRVHDTGIGIKPEDLAKIFNAFHQVDGTATREFGGSGLGLTIVKQLVDLLKGEIGVESEFGKGSTFILSLPYRADGRSPEINPAPERGSYHKSPIK